MKRTLPTSLTALLFGSAVLAAQAHGGLGAIDAVAWQAGGTYAAPVAAAPAVDIAPAGSNADSPFFRDAVAGGEREVMLSRLAMSQSTSAQVKSLASTMVSDHTAMNRELMAMGKVSEPPQTVADKRAAADMQKMTGRCSIAPIWRRWRATTNGRSRCSKMRPCTRKAPRRAISRGLRWNNCAGICCRSRTCKNRCRGREVRAASALLRGQFKSDGRPADWLNAFPGAAGKPRRLTGADP